MTKMMRWTRKPGLFITGMWLILTAIAILILFHSLELERREYAGEQEMRDPGGVDVVVRDW